MKQKQTSDKDTITTRTPSVSKERAATTVICPFCFKGIEVEILEGHYETYHPEHLELRASKFNSKTIGGSLC